MSFLLVSRRSRVDFKKWKSLHQPDFKRDPNLGGFGNAEIRLCQPNVSRDVKKYIVGAEAGKSRRSSHEETLKLRHNVAPMQTPHSWTRHASNRLTQTTEKSRSDPERSTDAPQSLHVT